jgi:hypothetical protein
MEEIFNFKVPGLQPVYNEGNLKNAIHEAESNYETFSYIIFFFLQCNVCKNS